MAGDKDYPTDIQGKVEGKPQDYTRQAQKADAPAQKDDSIKYLYNTTHTTF
jgi:hypothetical protein